ncbi:MAG TPA: hypothetical protein VGH11_07670 [Jatrophihabitans sp.]|jgi:hypothetical protein
MFRSSRVLGPIMAGALAGLVAVSTASIDASAAGNSGRQGPAAEDRHSTPSGIRTSARSCEVRKASERNPAGRCIDITAWGFAAGERVLLREYLQPKWQRILRADQHGVVTVRFESRPQAAASQQDVLTFVGLGAPSGSSATRGNVSIQVPRIAIYRFVPRSDGRAHGALTTE